MDKMPCSISDGPQLPEDVRGDESLVWVEECPECGEEYEADGYCKPCFRKGGYQPLKPITVEVAQISDDTLKELGVEECFQDEFMSKDQAE